MLAIQQPGVPPNMPAKHEIGTMQLPRLEDQDVAARPTRHDVQRADCGLLMSSTSSSTSDGKMAAAMIFTFVDPLLCSSSNSPEFWMPTVRDAGTLNLASATFAVHDVQFGSSCRRSRDHSVATPLPLVAFLKNNSTSAAKAVLPQETFAECNGTCATRTHSQGTELRQDAAESSGPLSATRRIAPSS
mmetsp:Transcript_3444/g.13314  ORF Transcript_3444/g.13314 Transcript_3444/m.13314 type:complete len:188 (+) Transcript_3444:3536-4099(+)